MLFDFFCLSLSNAALLAHAVIINLASGTTEGGIGEEVLTRERLNGVVLEKGGLKGLFFV
jgi:hypothetical protein